MAKKQSGKKTALYDIHIEQKGKMIEFAGHILPVQYSGIIEEHRAVRNSVGIFDLSHMGEFFFRGEEACDFLNYILANRIDDLEVRHIVYTPMCYPDGGIVDDLLCYRLSENRFMLVVNGACKDKDKKWIEENLSGRVNFEDRSDEITLIAVQGPDSEQTIQKITDMELSGIKYYWSERGDIGGQEVLISRTGYTGEDGFEIYLDKENEPVELYKTLLEAGEEFNIIPVGLGARNTLRLEKKYCLYGNDIDETTTPLEAGIGWTVKLDKFDFIGKEALLEQKKRGIKRKLVGFRMQDNSIPRKDYKIYYEGANSGRVTSGSFSPSLSYPIGLGYIDVNHSDVETEIEIEIRNKRHPATIVKTPFV